MNEPIAVKIPLVNPNEPEALVAAIQVVEGQQVAAGDVICSLETTKSAVDLTAERDGYVCGLRLKQGQSASAGEILCYLADTPEWRPPEELVDAPISAGTSDGFQVEMPAGLRITRPALALARQNGLDLESLPIGPLITERTVQEHLKSEASLEARPEFSPPKSAFDPNSIFIYGAGGHGKMVADLIRVQGLYRLLGFVDDGLPAGAEIMGIKVLGGSEILEKLYQDGIRLAVNAVGGIGKIGVRIQVSRRLASAGFVNPVLIHPSAMVEPSARLAEGSQVLAQAYLGSEATLGYGVIIGTGAIVSHDCRLGDFVNISPGAILAGAVEVGSGALVGMGATVNLEVKIGEGARVGNGATVKADVPAGGIVRAGTIWPE